MPKLSDHPKQKQLIAEAAWRVILEKGVHKASARTIAKEAGLSLGAMRYYFNSQEELLEYSEQLIHARIAEKIDDIFQDDLQPKAKIWKVLLCLLPSEEETTIEARSRISMKIANAKRIHPIDPEQDAAHIAVKNTISYLALLNLLHKEADLSFETERLLALINGLALEGSLHKKGVSKHTTESFIMYHLNSICIEKFGEIK